MNDVFLWNFLDDKNPWCYTTNPDVRWEYCPSSICTEDDIPFEDLHLNIENDEDRKLQDILDAERMCGQSICSSERIIGGTNSEPCQHPWVAQIVYGEEQLFSDETKGKHACGGTLIGSCWVLTAAHCIMIGKDNYDPNLLRDHIRGRTFRVRLGRKHKEQNERPHDQTFAIRNIIIHEEFKVNPK